MRYNWNLSSFAIYTLVNTSEESLQNVASQLEAEWLERQGDEGLQLIRVPTNHAFEGKSLNDILQSHISLLQEDIKHVEPYGEFNDGDLDWFPVAFIVLTSPDIKTVDPLLVYADPYDDGAECPTDKFRFRAGEASSMLAEIRDGGETCSGAKAKYATS